MSDDGSTMTGVRSAMGSTVGGDPSSSKRSSIRSSAIAKGAKGTVKFANKGVKALPGSAAKGVGNAAKFGANASSAIAKGTAKGVGNAAKVRKWKRHVGVLVCRLPTIATETC